ncbi:SDR family NAD(P)-dependent oxidoreductase [Hymenobacter sediminis]|uniref:SDR family NAD(P)-dependent oxidoreductase n=1 Tax=Hymenobacter sediminis TaxID=2218621 RepID=UPI000DA6A747|nr:SDR family NAD(P)-dependent oxidoreductase [Hymenobacter sediminis]RPD44100.1 SDR family NAD(P)-dependent oxidoreductase [Hymenobacter sediminis]
MTYALITGANKGIGYETAQQLLHAGYFVFLGCRDAASGQQAQHRLQEAGYDQVEVISLDVTSDESVQQAVAAVRRRTPHLDALVNNAGIPSQDLTQLPSATALADFYSLFETNYFGVVRTTQAFLPLLRQAAHPRIVNLSSSLGSLTLQADPTWEYYEVKPVTYCTSKALVNAWTILLAHELRDTPFKVNAVNPGQTATDFTGHVGHSPAHAAQLVANYVQLPPSGPTGQFFSEDGPTPW